MTPRSVRFAAAVVGVAAALILAGCGGNGDDPPEAAPEPAGDCPFVTITEADAADLDAKPAITIPNCPVPTELVTRDLVVGTGPEARAGQQVTMQYVGVAASTGEQFDASWDRGAPFGPFPLGAERVIAGWDEGIPGMNVGGRRELIIPPDMAYGPDGFPPAIGPNETLVFVVDLVAVEE